MLLNSIKKNEFTFHIGLCDKYTNDKKFDDKDFELVLKKICASYNIGYSMQYSDGGYVNENDEFVKEKSMILKIIGITDDVAEKIADDIIFFFNQERVYITKNIIDVLEIG